MFIDDENGYGEEIYADADESELECLYENGVFIGYAYPNGYVKITDGCGNWYDV